MDMMRVPGGCRKQGGLVVNRNNPITAGSQVCPSTAVCCNEVSSIFDAFNYIENSLLTPGNLVLVHGVRIVCVSSHCSCTFDAYLTSIGL